MNLERFCCAIFAFVPRVSTNLLLTWGAFTLIIQVCPRLSKPVGYIIGVPTFILYVVASVAYFQVCYVQAGSPLDYKQLVTPISMIEELQQYDEEQRNDILQDQLEAASSSATDEFSLLSMVSSFTTKDDGRPRYCSKCYCWKPDRAHHCRSCQKCVLKMDHHCPWFSTCIGFNNHKFFLQFLIYSSLISLLCFVGSVSMIFRFTYNQEYQHAYLPINPVILAGVSGALSLSVPVFTAFTVYIALQNKTTLENMEPTKYRTVVAPLDYRYTAPPSMKNAGNIFDLGVKNNWTQIMGRNWLEWLFPVNNRTIGNGIEWPIVEELWEEIQEIGYKERAMIERQRQRSYLLQQQIVQANSTGVYDQDDVPLASLKSDRAQPQATLTQ